LIEPVSDEHDETDQQVRPNFRKNAEVPAKLAAIMNGKSGRQQVDAARMLPIAARLAATVSAPLDGPDGVAFVGLVSLVIPGPSL